MQGKRQSETSLYGPVKRYLETLGYAVKGEVCGCDLVAIRGDEPPVVVIGELIALRRVMRSGSPSVHQGAKDSVIRVCTSSAAFLASACSAYRLLARSKCWSSLARGSPATIGNAALG